MLLALEDSDFLYFDRISAGTGYQDAIYQHTETATISIKPKSNGTAMDDHQIGRRKPDTLS